MISRRWKKIKVFSAVIRPAFWYYGVWNLTLHDSKTNKIATDVVWKFTLMRKQIARKLNTVISISNAGGNTITIKKFFFWFKRFTVVIRATIRKCFNVQQLNIWNAHFTVCHSHSDRRKLSLWTTIKTGFSII